MKRCPLCGAKRRLGHEKTLLGQPAPGDLTPTQLARQIEEELLETMSPRPWHILRALALTRALRVKLCRADAA